MVVWHCPCKSRSPPGALSQTLVTKVTGVCSFSDPRRSRDGGLFFWTRRKRQASPHSPSIPLRHPSERWRRFTTAKLVIQRVRRARTPFDLLLRCLHRAQALDPSVRWDDGEGTGTVRKSPVRVAMHGCSLRLSPIMQNAVDRRPAERPSRVCPCRNPTS